MLRSILMFSNMVPRFTGELSALMTDPIELFVFCMTCRHYFTAILIMGALRGTQNLCSRIPSWTFSRMSCSRATPLHMSLGLYDLIALTFEEMPHSSITRLNNTVLAYPVLRDKTARSPTVLIASSFVIISNIKLSPCSLSWSATTTHQV